MNSLAEKLVESWLDSQTERRYQSAFIQLLVARRWRVLHNTRHSPIELGKDVIARSPDGILYAFQLKGNPGSRLRKSEAQLILPQIVELITAQVPRLYLKSSSEKFVAVLVTNGDVDEEANFLLSQATTSIQQGLLPASRFEIWARGQLLADLSETVNSIWPTSVEGMRKILELNSLDGIETAPYRDVSRALRQISHSREAPKNDPARVAAITSTLLLLEIIKAPWRAKDNHYSLFVISIIGIVHCLPLAKSKAAKGFLSQYQEVALAHAADLIADAREQKYDPDYVWAQKDMFSEFDIMTERRRLIADCAASIVLAGKVFDAETSAYLRKLISISVEKPMLWGYGSVPALVVRWWAHQKLTVGLRSEMALATTLFAVVQKSNRHGITNEGLPAPYYSFEECWPWWKGLRDVRNDDIFADSFKSRVWFGRAIFFMLAKRNLKTTCKRIWPDFSRQNHEEFALKEDVFFEAELSRDGIMKTHTLYAQEWSALVAEATEAGHVDVLERHKDLAWVIAAYIAIVPYRAWTSVIMWLDDQLNRTWYGRAAD